jgi:hypothetical protein
LYLEDTQQYSWNSQVLHCKQVDVLKQRLLLPMMLTEMIPHTELLWLSKPQLHVLALSLRDRLSLTPQSTVEQRSTFQALLMVTRGGVTLIATF